MKRTPWSAEDEVEAVELYRAGKSLLELGLWFGRWRSSVRVMLIRRGVQMRPAHRHKAPPCE